MVLPPIGNILRAMASNEETIPKTMEFSRYKGGIESEDDRDSSVHTVDDTYIISGHS